MTDDAITAQLVAGLAERGGMGAHSSGYATLWRASVPAEYFAAVDDWASRHGARYLPALSIPRATQPPTAHVALPAEIAAHWTVPLDAIEQVTLETDEYPRRGG